MEVSKAPYQTSVCYKLRVWDRIIINAISVQIAAIQNLFTFPKVYIGWLE